VVVPWQEDLTRILGAVDALFSKPGGLTVCEALAAGVPLLLDACGGIIPQERGGARWVVAAGAGWIVEDPQAVPALLRGLSGADWETARRRARAALPGDAGTVLDRVMAALGASPRDGGGFGRPTLARAAAATGAAGRGGPEA